MARPLHNLFVGLFRLLVIGMCAGCVISPPIEPEPIAPDRPPFLDFMSPDDPIVTVAGPEQLTFSVRAFDENPHDALSVIWVGEEASPLVTSASRQSEVIEEDELFYRFDVIEKTIDPCVELEGVTRETLWVYVADAALDLSGRSVELRDPAGGGFLTSFTWILNIQPGACL